MHKIYVDASLFFIYYHKIYTNDKKFKFIKTYKHRPYMVPFAVKRSVNTHKGIVFNHNCIKLTVVTHTVLP